MASLGRRLKCRGQQKWYMLANACASGFGAVLGGVTQYAQEEPALHIRECRKL